MSPGLKKPFKINPSPRQGLTGSEAFSEVATEDSPTFNLRRKELVRLKQLKQICFILGVVFGIIGLISMCQRPTSVTNRVARKVDQKSSQAKEATLRLVSKEKKNSLPSFDLAFEL